jgi:hypothetical protein
MLTLNLVESFVQPARFPRASANRIAFASIFFNGVNPIMKRYWPKLSASYVQFHAITVAVLTFHKLTTRKFTEAQNALNALQPNFF